MTIDPTRLEAMIAFMRNIGFKGTAEFICCLQDAVAALGANNAALIASQASDQAQDKDDLRDRFAGMALPEAIRTIQRLVSKSPELREAAQTAEGARMALHRIASMAYGAADAMLAERAKERTS